MEVHHHPDLHHKPKPWKEYFLEFLMIFLAVTMGFIAENVRENISNREHARQLASQLVQDLKTDTVALHQIDSAETRILKGTDSLSELLKPPMKKIDMKRMQQLVLNGLSFWPFHESTGAITAIKNELHLKQFSNSRIGNYIADYEARADILHQIEVLLVRLHKDNIESFARLHFTQPNYEAGLKHKPIVDGQMRNLNQSDLTQLNIDLVLVRDMTTDLIGYNRRLKAAAIEIIQYVTRQFDVE